MRDPYKVAVWGPGAMGKAAIRELLRLPETELVSVLAYNSDNDGSDVGALLNTGPTGVKVTTSIDTLVAAKPEVVIHTARDFADFRADDDIVRLLERGINVISVLPYQYPRARGEKIDRRFAEAGRKGNATLHGTGIDPGFLYERLAAVMTGLSNDIEYIKLKEMVCLVNYGPDILNLFGFGNTPSELLNNEVAVTMAENYLTMGMHYLADKLGLPIDRIGRVADHVLANQKTTIANGFSVEKDTIGKLQYQWTGYVKGKPIFVIEVYWYLDDDLRPEEARGDDYWIVEIEGLPSTRVGLEIKGSIRNNETLTPRNPAPPAYLATIVPAIQAIPVVIAAAPGVLEAEMPQFHWKPDMRL